MHKLYVTGCRYCAAGMSTRSWVMRYIITSLASILLCCIELQPIISNHLVGTACSRLCSTLDSFELLNVSGSVGVLGCSCILYHRSDEKSVALGLDLAWAS